MLTYAGQQRDRVRPQVRPPRRFPPPWRVEEITESFYIRDDNGQALAYVYFEDEPGRRGVMKRPTKDEARRIAANMAKLPDSFGRSCARILGLPQEPHVSS